MNEPIDLDKVTKFPWRESDYATDPGWIDDQHGNPIASFSCVDEERDSNNAKLAVLFSRVLDVQMRRGWEVRQGRCGMGWQAHIRPDCHGLDQFRDWHDHPIRAYEALVAADEWLTEQENKEPK